MAAEVDQRLIDKLEEIAARRDELNAQLHDPEVACDPNRSIAISKEIGRLKRLADPYVVCRTAPRSSWGEATIGSSVIARATF